MIVTGIPTALLFIPWCWLTGNVMPLYKGTRFMLSQQLPWPACASTWKAWNSVPKRPACIFMSNHVPISIRLR